MQLTITESFLLGTRGTAATLDVPPPSPIAELNRVRVIRPDGAAVETVAERELVQRASGEEVALLFPGLTPKDIPVGSRVTVLGALARPQEPTPHVSAARRFRQSVQIMDTFVATLVGAAISFVIGFAVMYTGAHVPGPLPEWVLSWGVLGPSLCAIALWTITEARWPWIFFIVPGAVGVSVVGAIAAMVFICSRPHACVMNMH